MITPLFPTADFYSHMPFVAADGRLVFCRAGALAVFQLEPSKFALQRGMIEGQRVEYRPWALAFRPQWDAGEIEDIALPFPITSFRHVYCSPVIDDAGMSFVYAGRVWRQPTGAVPSETDGACFTGFRTATDAASIGKAPCVCRDGVTTPVPGFASLLRVVPDPFSGGYLLTGRLADGACGTVRANAALDAFARIRVNGADVYKCCFTPTGEMIFAERLTGFEERRLMVATAEEISLEPFSG